VSPACRAFSATTRLAAKAGKQSCSVAQLLRGRRTCPTDQNACSRLLTRAIVARVSFMARLPLLAKPPDTVPGGMDAFGRPVPCPQGLGLGRAPQLRQNHAETVQR
jgi:hypothetical protein